jgi:hypothetical protein
MPCNEENYSPNVEHDPEDPPMVVGSTYANMETFKLAISQHAIKNQFEFNTTIGSGHIVQGEAKTTVHGGYLLLPLRIIALL